MSDFQRHHPLLTRNGHQGFTWWEILLVITLMGILGAMALPTIWSRLMSCENKANNSEARNHISTMNRAQQSYFLEYEKFAGSLEELQVAIKSQSHYYKYSIVLINKKAVFHYAIAQKESTKGYVGAVFAVPAPKKSGVKDEVLTIAIACETNSPTTKQPPAPIYQNGTFICAEGTKSLAR